LIFTIQLRIIENVVRYVSDSRKTENTWYRKYSGKRMYHFKPCTKYANLFNLFKLRAKFLAYCGQGNTYLCALQNINSY